MSVIDGETTSAFVQASVASELFAIHEDDFWERLAPLPGLLRNLTRILTQRFRSANTAAIHLLAQQLRLEHLQRELAAAGSLQTGMLPHAPLFPNHPQARVRASLIPAKEVGGDLYDALPLNDDEILVGVGDVSGKGMPAALFMMRTLTLLRSHAGLCAPTDDLAGTLNRRLCENNPTNMFVTLGIAILSVRDGRVRLINAGHPPPLLSRCGGEFNEVRGAKGALMGVIPGARYTTAEIRLEPGDRLLFYTDGVTEAENPFGEQFSLTRTLELLNGLGNRPAAELTDALVEGVARFAEGAPQSDDITLLALDYLGGEETLPTGKPV